MQAEFLCFCLAYFATHILRLQELETVSTEVEGLIRQANEGGDMSNIKSSASGSISFISLHCAANLVFSQNQSRLKAYNIVEQHFR